MKSPLVRRGAGAFTLVEMLTVIAIIAILAALLLPALQQGKARAKFAGCENNLNQMGIAFQSFSHDHNSKFPMQVAKADGGAQEFVQNGYRVNGQFYFAYHIFQSLADELVTPNLLICPTDTRVAATNFTGLHNENVSYFVGVDADYSQPESILAGDRNLVPDANRSIYPAASEHLRWSETMHQYKGNLLFADAHVEESKNYPMAGGTAQNDLFLPSVTAAAIPFQTVSASQNFPSQSGTDNNNPASGNPVNNSAATGNSAGANPPPAVFNGHSVPNNNSVVSLNSPTADATPTNRSVVVVQPATNAVATTNDDLAGMSYFDRRAVKVFQNVFGWGYSLLLLLFLVWLYFKLRREWRLWQQRRQKR